MPALIQVIGSTQEIMVPLSFHMHLLHPMDCSEVFSVLEDASISRFACRLPAEHAWLFERTWLSVLDSRLRFQVVA